MQSEDQVRRKRETMLTVVLMAIGVGAFVLFLNFVSLGVFFYVIVATAVIGGVGWLHYMLWGQSLTEEVAQQRQTFLRQQERELGEMDNPYAIQVKRPRLPPTNGGEGETGPRI